MNFRVGMSLIHENLNGRSGWVAGLYYVKNCLNAIASLPRNSIPEVFVFIREDFKENLLLPEYANNADWLNIISVSIEGSVMNNLQNCIDEYACDVFFPFNGIPDFVFAKGMIGWIPDLQEKYYPHYFSEQELEYRETISRFLLEYGNKVVCSSQSAYLDIERFYPSYKDKVVAIPFRSSLSEDILNQDPRNILDKYEIDKKYLFLPNQFWIHKNHKIVFEAFNLLKSVGDEILLICTGSLNDYRFLEYFPELERYIAENQLSHMVKILGFVPRHDQIQLMRCASALLQPSLFEGWSTSIEEARSLGKVLLLSNIPVHYEQAAEQAYYFDKNNPIELKNLIQNLWSKLPEGWNSESEKLSFASYRSEVNTFANRLVTLFKSVIQHQSTDVTVRNAFIKINQKIFEKENEIQKITHYCREKELRLINLSDEYARKRHDLEILTAQLNKKPFERTKQWFSKNMQKFKPKLGVLVQHTPRKMEIPMEYYNVEKLETYPRISVVTPSFNQGAFVERTLLSVLDQNYPNLEYFIQDGGSKDESVNIFKKYTLDLTHWNSEADSGQTNAINKGFKKTSGEIMCYLNSDDILLPNTLNYIAQYFVANPEIDVVYGHRILINENDEEIGRWVLPKHNDDVLTWVDYIPQETLFWRRRIWDKVGGTLDEEFKFAMDWDLLLRFKEANARFVRLPRFLGGFRVHNNQKTSAEIGQTGVKEMQRLRFRAHGREVSQNEIRYNTKNYLLKSVFYHKLYRLGLLRF